jgi:dTDP-4-amino-4,6-dideoxygalactose transaminase
VSDQLPLSAPSFDEAEAQAVADVVRSGWLTMGPRTARFEGEFAAFVGSGNAVMASSCTAALHLAFAALDLGPGDEVIVPSLTFVATANAVAYTGATPVFADIVSPEVPLIDPEAVRALIGPRTRAICPVHYAGYVADMVALRALCDRHGLALVEDAAHSPGARSPEGPAGSLGDISCFSFFSNKNLVTGEGGMATSDDDHLVSRMRLLRAHGMTATSWDRERGHASGYDVVERGYNYRPSELEAALGLVQLGKLPGMLARRRDLVGMYRRGLAGAPETGFIPFTEEGDALSSCHILPLVTPDPEAREDVRAAAAAAGVQTSVHYQPVHGFKVFQPQEPLPITEDYARREVTLPLYPAMADSDVDRVLDLFPVRARAGVA